MTRVSEEEIGYWRSMRRYGYGYDTIARKSWERFRVKRSKSTIFKYAHDVDEMLEDESLQWNLPRFTVSKRTRLRAAGLVERFDMDLDDILEQCLDSFELMRENNLDFGDLMRIREFLEKLEKERKSAGIVIWILDLVDYLEKVGINTDDFSEIRKSLEEILSLNLSKDVISHIPEIFRELSKFKLMAEDLSWILSAINNMAECGLSEDAVLLLMKELDGIRRSGKSWEEACVNLINRVDTKLDLERASEEAGEELDSIRESVADIQRRESDARKSMGATIAMLSEKRSVIGRQIREAHVKLQELNKETDVTAKTLEMLEEKALDVEARVREGLQELDRITQEVSEKKEWLKENGEQVDRARGFLDFVAAESRTNRVRLLAFAQALVQACMNPRAGRSHRDLMNAYSKNVQEEVYNITARSTGHIVEFYAQETKLMYIKATQKLLEQRIKDLERENATLRSKVRSAKV